MNNCENCQCQKCKNNNCESKCKSHFVCDNPVTNCKDSRIPNLIEIMFIGIDDWSRPVYKDRDNNYYGSTFVLVDYNTTPEEVNKKFSDMDDPAYYLCYFGNKFNCEPMGTPVKNLKIVSSLSNTDES